MNATEARLITDKEKEFPEGIWEIFRNIHMIASYGHDEMFFPLEELTEQHKEHLREHGYYLKNVKHVFGVAEPPKDAIKISW